MINRGVQIKEPNKAQSTMRVDLESDISVFYHYRATDYKTQTLFVPKTHATSNNATDK